MGIQLDLTSMCDPNYAGDDPTAMAAYITEALALPASQQPAGIIVSIPNADILGPPIAAAIVRADHSAVRRKVESAGPPSVNHGVGRDEEELDLVAEPHAARLLDHIFLTVALDVTPPDLALFHLLEMPSLHSRAHIAQLQLRRRLRAPLFENSTHGLHVLLEEVGW